MLKIGYLWIVVQYYYNYYLAFFFEKICRKKVAYSSKTATEYQKSFSYISHIHIICKANAFMASVFIHRKGSFMLQFGSRPRV